jgi:hypothetical protein
VEASLPDDTDGTANNNTLIGLALGFGVGLLAWFIAVLLDSKSGEQAGALGAVVGGIIGAGGAVLAVYLTLARQRRDDAAKVRAALRTEVSTYSKYVIGALDVCQQVATRAVGVPMANAAYITKNLIDPVVYPAVADRVALLRRPQATVEFYMRVQEAKAMTAMMAASVSGMSSAQSAMQTVQPSNAEAIADSLITALQLAHSIASDADGLSSQMDLWIRDAVLQNIDDALRSAQQTFPNAESFKRPA